jgi:hypothetical protein
VPWLTLPTDLWFTERVDFAVNYAIKIALVASGIKRTVVRIVGIYAHPLNVGGNSLFKWRGDFNGDRG